jgi:hypothetical protein
MSQLFSMMNSPPDAFAYAWSIFYLQFLGVFYQGIPLQAISTCPFFAEATFLSPLEVF